MNLPKCSVLGRALGLGAALLWCQCGSRSKLDQLDLLVTNSAPSSTAGRPNAGAGGTSDSNAGVGASAGDAGGAGAGAGGSNAGRGGSAMGGAATAGTAGTTAAAGAAGAPCIPNQEVCNGLDDDCDGEIDEGLPLEIAEGPVVVRNDEGSTGNCTYCNIAGAANVLALGDELAVVWLLGTPTGQIQPNVFMRRLTWDLQPKSEVSPLGSGDWLGIERGQAEPRGTLLTFFNETFFNDRTTPSYAFVDSNSMVSEPVPLAGCVSFFNPKPLVPGLMVCGKGSKLQIFSVDERAGTIRSDHEQDVTDGIDTEPVGAQNGDHRLIALSSGALWTLEIGADGAPLAAPLQQSVNGVPGLMIDQLLPAPGGYMVFGHIYTENMNKTGWFMSRLRLDGHLNGSPIQFDQGAAGYLYTDAFRNGSGYAFVGTKLAEGTQAGRVPDRITIAQVDEAGAIIQHLDQTVGPTESRPSVLFSHGSLYVALSEYYVNAHPSGNRVYISRFRCAPKSAVH